MWKAVLDESKAGGVPGYSVAVKTALEAEGDGADEMTREALVMAQLDHHPNVVSIIGVVTSGLPLMLLLSFCERGSVKSALLAGEVIGQRKPKDVPPHSVVCQMALEIACGMVHLVEHCFVHRDLASRNILLDALGVCKIADFGLSRGIHRTVRDVADEEESEYYKSQRGMFPVRWTAPEAMESLRFSMSTDMWSFGVVLLEIMTGGGMPYPEISTNNEVITKIMRGYHTPQPDGCSDEVYRLYTQCCSLQPSDRPLFSNVVTLLEREIQSEAAASVDTSMAVEARQHGTENRPTGGQDVYAARGNISDSAVMPVAGMQQVLRIDPAPDDEQNVYAQTMATQIETKRTKQAGSAAAGGNNTYDTPAPVQPAPARPRITFDVDDDSAQLLFSI